MASQQQASHTPESIRDKWATPQWLFNFFDHYGHYDIDLAANRNNAKVKKFFTEKQDALSKDWHKNGYRGWCNPPYSNIAPWLEKAWEEVHLGFHTSLLVPTPNGERHYGDFVFGKASRVIFINGRVPFVASEDFIVPGKNGKPDRAIKKGEEVGGNTRGSCLIVYSPYEIGNTELDYLERDYIKEIGSR